MTKIIARTLTELVSAQSAPTIKKNLLVVDSGIAKMGSRTVEQFTFKEASLFDSIKMAFSQKKREAQAAKFEAAVHTLRDQEFKASAISSKTLIWKDLGVKLMPDNLFAARAEALHAKADTFEALRDMGKEAWARLKKLESIVAGQRAHTVKAEVPKAEAAPEATYAAIDKNKRNKFIVTAQTGHYASVQFAKSVNPGFIHRPVGKDGVVEPDVIYSTVQAVKAEVEQPIYGTVKHVRNVRDPLPEIPRNE